MAATTKLSCLLSAAFSDLDNGPAPISAQDQVEEAHLKEESAHGPKSPTAWCVVVAQLLIKYHPLHVAGRRQQQHHVQVHAYQM
jgi:hypothetical protein